MSATGSLSLVPDCGGLIRTIAIALPASFFADDRPDNSVSPLVPIGNLLSALPFDVTAIVIVDRISLLPAQNWLDRLGATCTVTLMPLDGNSGVTHPWIQDMFHVRAGKEGAGELVMTAGNALAGQLADRLGFAAEFSDVALAGGNQLVGLTFGWWAIPACRMMAGSGGVLRTTVTNDGSGFRRSTAEPCIVSDIGRKTLPMPRHHPIFQKRGPQHRQWPAEKCINVVSTSTNLFQLPA